MMFLLLTKKDEWSCKAAQIARIIFDDQICIIPGKRGDPMPEEISWCERGGAILSFLSPWVVSSHALERSRLAVNFHCGSTEYPGIGSYNFALYDGAKEFGGICHHMSPHVDTGSIIEERRFPIFAQDTVETLKLRTMAVMLAQFHDILCRIALGDELRPNGALEWTRPPFTRKELNELTIVMPDMSTDEIARRVRATTYPGQGGPMVILGGIEFRSEVPGRAPLA